MNSLQAVSAAVGSARKTRLLPGMLERLLPGMLEHQLLALAAVLLIHLLPPTAVEAAPGDSLVTNHDFSNGLEGWSAYPNAAVEQETACLDVPAGTGAYSAAIEQLVQLQPSTAYRVDLVAYLPSGTPGPLRVVVQMPGPPYSQYLPEEGISSRLQATPTSFSFEFETPSETPDEGVPNAGLLVQQSGANNLDYRLCVETFDLVEIEGLSPYQPDTGPRVRVNHVGYATHGPKRATLVASSTTPLPWELLDHSGRNVTSGISTPHGRDPSAGLNVHVIDFGRVTQEGDNHVLVADGESSFPFRIGVDRAYQQLRYDALNYYYPARSGLAIDADIAGEAYAREAGHMTAPNQGVPNQGDLQVPCQSYANQTNDAGEFYYGTEWTCPDDYTLDVVGGWYDAGDHGKYVVNGGISVAQMMGIYERSLWAPTGTPKAYQDNTLKIPETNNRVPDVLDEARWQLEWMLSMQVPAGSGPQSINGQSVDVSGMVHHKIHDEGWTGLPLLPAESSQVRSLHRPSTAATLNLAAAAAQGARLWAPYDLPFAQRLLEAAEVAYGAALKHPDIYAPEADGAEGGGPYNDSNVEDEFYWAAAELYLTTGAQKYERDLRASPLHAADIFDEGGFNWASLAPIARMNLATVPNSLSDRDRIRASVVAAGNKYLRIQRSQPFGHPYAGVSGTYVWGSNSQILNNMVVMAVAYDISHQAQFRSGVLEAMDYLLGRNALGWSYLTGYGEPGYTSTNQHSRWWAQQLTPTLPPPPPGTIAGGPNSDANTWDPFARSLFEPGGCAPQRCYIDDIRSWATNELTINWNAPMAWVAAFLADQQDGKAQPFGSCTVAYLVHDRWPDGTNTQVILTNTGHNPIQGWKLSWPTTGNASIVHGWSGAFSEHGGIVTVENLSWNGLLRPHQPLTFGFISQTGTFYHPQPTTFRLNGEVCRVTTLPSGERP